MHNLINVSFHLLYKQESGRGTTQKNGHGHYQHIKDQLEDDVPQVSCNYFSKSSTYSSQCPRFWNVFEPAKIGPTAAIVKLTFQVRRLTFNSFTNAHHVIYKEALASAPLRLVGQDQRLAENLETAITSAGAVLSASDGLGYTSSDLFVKLFPGLPKYGR
ncbi:uncharacterized protein LY79DRAFT_659610 [Colletotrichum navitas]|uniref:Uncharacterized protein n=1 Tax=Colletotrichum navitas TaxID=681940 RepID=A0AAD8Q077_9PEZI|nr:uncharacterized protein LY79DRAFT_659610 [Colletotrichum navitas]KAK1590337.1 hypothetical protein LY79DRAFT_659610 [Colletotrichum navitas]